MVEVGCAVLVNSILIRNSIQLRFLTLVLRLVHRLPTLRRLLLGLIATRQKLLLLLNLDRVVVERVQYHSF
jgi:hypothetical protein